MATFFSDYFDIDSDALDEYGAFNVSIINDLPLFIDPFLLFDSEKEEYRDLLNSIIRYLIFLRSMERASQQILDDCSQYLYYRELL